jgi:uncharacterized protein YjaG (DUF416 family)
MTIDDIIATISSELLELPPPRIATFAAACSERFIGFYEEFSAKAGWGDFTLIRAALDAVWSFLSEEARSDRRLEIAYSNVKQQTPHSDDFDIEETLFAQDACICLLEAINWCLGRTKKNPDAIVEFSFEALRFARTLVYTGCYQLGSSPEAKEFEKLLVREAVIVKEWRLQREDLELIQGAVRLSPDVINTIRTKAEKHRWTTKEVLGEGYFGSR